MDAVGGQRQFSEQTKFDLSNQISGLKKVAAANRTKAKENNKANLSFDQDSMAERKDFQETKSRSRKEGKQLSRKSSIKHQKLDSANLV